MKLNALLLTVMCSFPVLGSNAWATPAQILIIRHAEKLDTGSELSPAGEARAQALVHFFEQDSRVNHFGPPVAIYAMAPSKDDSSVRAIQTVTPLAQTLNMQIHEEFTKKEVGDAAAEILNDVEYEGRMVLICWDHQYIPALANALGIPNPPTWSGKIFDRVWMINYNLSQVSGFFNLPQHLMPGDSPQ